MIDSNIFLYTRENVPVMGIECDTILQRIARTDVEGFTTTSIVGETTHRVICAEAIRRYGLTPRTVVRTLRSTPDLVKGLTEHLAIPEGFLAMSIVILPVTADALVASKVHRQAYGLPPAIPRLLP